jgi:hypothetical protein
MGTVALRAFRVVLKTDVVKNATTKMSFYSFFLLFISCHDYHQQPLVHDPCTGYLLW